MGSGDRARVKTHEVKVNTDQRRAWFTAEQSEYLRGIRRQERRSGSKNPRVLGQRGGAGF